MAVKPIGHIQRVHSRRGGRQLSVPLNPLRGARARASGGKKKADPIDDDGGLIKAQAGTTVLGGARTTNLANPIASGVQTLAAPQAASSQFVSVPGTTPKIINP